MRVLTIAGTADKLGEFDRKLRTWINDPFKVTSVVPLAEDEDGTKHFLAFAHADEASDEQAEALAALLGDDYEVVYFESDEEAQEWADETYGEAAYSTFMEEPIDPREIFQRDVFVGLVKTD